MPERLFLTALKKGRWANTVRAVRDARGLLYNEDRPSINTAGEIVKALRESGEAQLVGENDDLDVVNTAAELFTDCAEVEVNPIIESPEHVLAEGDDELHLNDDQEIDLSIQGVRASLVCMGVANGNAPGAMQVARFYFQATHDPIWLEVHHLIRTTFMPGQPVVVPPTPDEVA